MQCKTNARSTTMIHKGSILAAGVRKGGFEVCEALEDLDFLTDNIKVKVYKRTGTDNTYFKLSTNIKYIPIDSILENIEVCDLNRFQLRIPDSQLAKITVAINQKYSKLKKEQYSSPSRCGSTNFSVSSTVLENIVLGPTATTGNDTNNETVEFSSISSKNSLFHEINSLVSKALAHDVEAHDVEARDVEAHDVEAHDVEAHDVEAHDVEAHDDLQEISLYSDTFTGTSKTLEQVTDLIENTSFSLPVFYVETPEDEQEICASDGSNTSTLNKPQQVTNLIENTSLDLSMSSLHESNSVTSNKPQSVTNLTDTDMEIDKDNAQGLYYCSTDLIENTSFSLPVFYVETPEDEQEICASDGSNTSTLNKPQQGTNLIENTSLDLSMSSLHESNSVTSNKPQSVTNLTDTDMEIDKDNAQGLYYCSTKKKGPFNDKRVYDKRHVCFYCHEKKSKMTRHLASNHSKEIDVGKLLALPKESRKRKEGFLKILRMGDFFHNCEVLSKEEGELILVRRPSENEAMYCAPSDFGPCPDCAGFMIKKHLWHHAKSCFLTKEKRLGLDENKERNSVIQQSNALLVSSLGPTMDSSFQNNVLDKLQKDERGEVARKDSLIQQFGLSQYEKHANQQFELIRQSMRQCSRLLIELRNIENLPEAGLADFINPNKFDTIILAVRNICSKTECSAGIPSMALKLGFHLQKCAGILRGRFLRAGLLDEDDKTKRFLKLYRLEWNEKISARALDEIKTNKMNVANALPLTSDLMKLNSHLQLKLKTLKNDFEQNKFNKEIWLEMAKICLCRLILFNKKRAGEASKMKVRDFTHVEWASESSMELQKSLSELEKHLAETLTLVQIRGKRGRTVPILITPDVKTVMDLLMENRANVGVDHKNEFFFARPYYNSLTHIRGSDCVRDIVNQVHLERPELITSTKLRKYIATVSQVFNLDERQVDWLARHLGHDLMVHRNFYRLHESALELTKVSKILLAVDKGVVHKFKGKNIEELTLEDLYEDDEIEKPTEGSEHLYDSAGSGDQSENEDETTPEPKQPIALLRADEDMGSGTRRRHTVKTPRMTWSESQKEKALKFFRKEISNYKVPGKERCNKFIDENTELENVSWLKVKQFVHNYLNKTRKRLSKI